MTRFGGVYTHDAIYMGGTRVVHIFRDKSDSSQPYQARHGTWQDFMGKSYSVIDLVSIVVYRLRLRSVDQIMGEANSLVEQQFGAGKYDFLKQNCQHFASYCCTGQQVSIDVIKGTEEAIKAPIELSPIAFAESFASIVDAINLPTATRSPLDNDPSV